jgi:hypothetical protein
VRPFFSATRSREGANDWQASKKAVFCAALLESSRFSCNFAATVRRHESQNVDVAASNIVETHKIEIQLC